MYLLRKRGRAPHFSYEQFQERRRQYDSGDAKKEWRSLEDLRSAAAACVEGTILGHIRRDTALEWLGWKHGELYAVGYYGDAVFCIPEGDAVVGQ